MHRRCELPLSRRAARTIAGVKARVGALLHRLISIADEPNDDDDLRLRKRVGVATGYVIGVGGLLLPAMAQGLALSWVVALTMSPVSAINLAVLARTKRFDRYVVLLILAVTATCGVEKIKTIGDSYMAVAGAPEARSDHAEAAVALARGMLGALAEVHDRAEPTLDLRIGLASGSVVGGVIGQKRILFDLWGDTVNVASRMESSGVPGRIQVAPSTYALLRESAGYSFEAREPIEVKGLGVMETYLLVDD